MPNPLRGYHTIADVARALGVSRQRVHQLLAARGITPARVGSLAVVATRELAALRRRVPGRPWGPHKQRGE